MRVVGIDPGAVSGAYALIDSVDAFEVGDLPAIDKQVCAPLLAELLQRLRPDMVIVESVSAMPGNGVTGMFRFGESVGLIDGVVGALQIPSMKVRPAVWKKEFGLLRTGKGKEIKEASRFKVCEMWPQHARHFARVKDSGKAEALLIATYYLRFHLRTA